MGFHPAANRLSPVLRGRRRRAVSTIPVHIMSAPPSVPSTSDANPIAESIAAELSVAMPDAGRVTRSCAALKLSLGAPLSAEDVALLRGLGAILRTRSDREGTPLAELLEAAAAQCPDPWPL